MNKSFLCILLLLPFLLPAQNKSIPLHISFFNESTSVPFTKLLTKPFHPGIQTGTEFTIKARKHSRLFQTVNLNYYYHQHLNQGIAAFTEIGYSHRIGSRFAVAGLLGLGYLHTIATADEFVFADGHYELRKDKGNARLYPTLSFDISCRLNSKSIQSPSLFLRYQAWAEYPYSPGFIPVMTHINLHAGATFFIIKSHQHK
jgi:hypothetical protein